jgi:hypothetical protein
MFFSQGILLLDNQEEARMALPNDQLAVAFRTIGQTQDVTFVYLEIL